MIDYELLGALIGSAWRENHPNIDEPYSPHFHRIMNALNVPPGKDFVKFADSLGRAMVGYCAFCGTSSAVGRRGDGVYCCLDCVGC